VLTECAACFLHLFARRATMIVESTDPLSDSTNLLRLLALAGAAARILAAGSQSPEGRVWVSFVFVFSNCELLEV
jgi:hypothetical protein